MGDTPDFIPWYRSAVVRRLTLSITVQLAAVTHTSKYLAGVDLGALIDDLLEIAGMAYAGWAMHARVTRAMPGLTTTQAKADVANMMPRNDSKLE
jgi:hypothetical protein